MQKISISISGHRTSISLEREFIDALRKIATSQNKSVASIISDIDSKRSDDINLSSAIRVFVLKSLT